MTARRATATATARVACAAVVGLLAAGCSDGDRTAAAPSTTLTPAATTTTAGATTTSTAGREPDLTTPVRLRQVASLDQPVAFAARVGSTTVYVAERGGLVRALLPDGSGGYRTADEPTLDLRDDVLTDGLEQGLLGIAFDPTGEHLVVSYSAADDEGASVLARYEMSGDHAVVESRREVFRMAQPFPNHNGGNVVFGPDGYLYAGFGDGGSQGDPDDNGQDPTTLLATIIRIDPSAPEGDRGYRIPADNPFADAAENGARPEVWLYGVRNPWRFSFDRATGDLWVGDVGGSRYEEVDVLRAADGGGRGANLGWSLREGRHDTEKPGDRPGDLVEPVHEYDHDAGASVTGGYVYRGSAIPGLVGAYLFSDWGQSTLRAVPADVDRATDSSVVPTEGTTLNQVSSFGEDLDGELWVLSLEGGVYRIEPA